MLMSGHIEVDRVIKNGREFVLSHFYKETKWGWLFEMCEEWNDGSFGHLTAKKSKYWNYTELRHAVRESKNWFNDAVEDIINV